MVLATNMKRGPANESIQVAVVGSIWGFGGRTDGPVSRLLCSAGAVPPAGRGGSLVIGVTWAQGI